MAPRDALRPVEAVVAIGIVLLGLLVCAGWLGDVRMLRQPFPGATPMVFNTALLFVAIGGALLCGLLGRRAGVTASAGFCLLVAGSTLVEYSAGVDLGIDQLLAPVGEWTISASPGRMGANTAAAFVCAAAALLAIERAAYILAAMLGSVTLALGIIPLLGFVVGAAANRGLGVLTPMAPCTAIAHTVLGLTLTVDAWRRHSTSTRERASLPASLGAVGMAVLTVLAWQTLDVQQHSQWRDDLEQRATNRAERIAEIALIYSYSLTRMVRDYALDPPARMDEWRRDAAFALRILPPEAGIVLMAGSGEALAQEGLALPVAAQLGPVTEPPVAASPIGPRALRVVAVGGRLWMRVVIADSGGTSWGTIAHFPLQGLIADERARNRRVGLQLSVDSADAHSPDTPQPIGATRVRVPPPLDMLTIQLRDTRSMRGGGLITLLLISGIASTVLIGAIVAQMQRERDSRLLGERLALELERANTELHTLAATDALTGVANRRQFETLARNTLLAAQRQPDAVALLLLDLDHFKRVNDTWGHGAGDVALCAVADCITPLLRPLDVLGRVGGEEFAVLLPDAPASEALRVAERLCEAVRGCAIEVPGTVLHLTISIGVACCPQDGDSYESLRNCADQRLYAAKAAGRDRVVS